MLLMYELEAKSCHAVRIWLYRNTSKSRAYVANVLLSKTVSLSPELLASMELSGKGWTTEECYGGPDNLSRQHSLVSKAKNFWLLVSCLHPPSVWVLVYQAVLSTLRVDRWTAEKEEKLEKGQGLCCDRLQLARQNQNR